jgi:glycosyltransferase involved in cell wall biosynthesis
MLGYSGIGTYLKNLLENYARMDCDFSFRLACPRQESVREFGCDRFTWVRADAPIYSLREQWEILRLAQGADVLHCPHYNIPYFYRGPMVVTIHDVNHLVMRQFLPSRLAYYYARFMMRAAGRHATRVITDSQHSMQLIRAHLSVPEEKIRVIYLGLGDRFQGTDVSPDAARLQKFGICKPYVLYVGNIKPHKNIQGLLRAFSLLNPALRNSHHLVIVGKKEDFQTYLHQLAEELRIATQIVFTDYVTDDDLRNFYAGASVLVLPSFTEGFGLPALEAMANGVPVIASNSSSLPEVVGSAGILVDPKETGSIANAITQVLSDPARHRQLVERGKERAQLFSARKAATEHLEVLREVARASA